ncbi:MAG: sigma-70 family RNA polymerase sigma factor [Candidatus Poribacteria bacterium]|nr:sigma-70 family RNA polymerase sigma factor [Candidatus Poribacteria bacterium]
MVNDNVELIHRILSGEDEAFSVLVRKYQRRVHALIWRKIGDFHIAEEITQDAFLKVYKKLPTLKNPNLFDGWLYVIANRLCLNWIQRNKPAIRQQSIETTPIEEIEKSFYANYESEHRETEAAEHHREIVKNLLEKLPESERTVMTLHYLGEMSCKAIGEFLGVSPNTVKSRLQRARNRLKEQEDMIRETLGSIQLPANFTENIIRQVAEIKPIVPTSSKPIAPWAVSAATAILMFLIMGIGSEHLARFQKPYNLMAQSEATVEIIDAPIVLDTQAKPDLRNQAGRFDAIGKNTGAGPQVSAPVLLAAAEIEKEARPPTKQQWVQASGPEEGRGVSGLLASSWGDVYTVTKIGIYKLAPDASAWTLISPLPPEASVDDHGIQMTERNNTLYILFTNSVFASKDRGETWIKLGERPKGVGVGLVVTDDALYLALRDEGIFRSTDTGKQWTPLNNEIEDIRISAIAAVENTVFIGTNRGLYRLHSETWVKLPITTKMIHSLFVSGNNLYVGTGRDLSQAEAPEGMQAHLDEVMRNMNSDVRTWEVFYSTDLGDSWTDITPTSKSLMMKISSGVKVLAVEQSVLILGMVSFHSTDGGKTWTELGQDSMTMLSWIPAVAVDEKTFFKVEIPGLTRSTDGGKSWHSFTNGIIGTSIRNLVGLKNEFYTSTSKGLTKSTDGGESWKNVDVNPGELTLKPPERPYSLISPKLAIADGILYGAASTLVPEHKLHIYRLSVNRNVLVPLQGVPALEDAPSTIDMVNWADKTTLRETYPSAFAVSGETFYAEYMRQLLRWKRGESEWFNTGLVDEDKSRDENDGFMKNLRLAVSDETVYAGKRDGSLFQSFDSGNTWKDLTSSLPLRFERFNDITFAGSTVYVATDAGVLVSENGEHWRAITDKVGTHTLIDQIAVDTTTVYGAGDEGVYKLNHRDEWEKISPEVPDSVTSLVINNDRLYIITEHQGMFHISLEKE